MGTLKLKVMAIYFLLKYSYSSTIKEMLVLCVLKGVHAKAPGKGTEVVIISMASPITYLSAVEQPC